MSDSDEFVKILKRDANGLYYYADPEPEKLPDEVIEDQEEEVIEYDDTPQTESTKQKPKIQRGRPKKAVAGKRRGRKPKEK